MWTSVPPARWPLAPSVNAAAPIPSFPRSAASGSPSLSNPLRRLRCAGGAGGGELIVEQRGITNFDGARGQGLTLIHFSAQLEARLTQGNTLHPLKTP